MGNIKIGIICKDGIVELKMTTEEANNNDIAHTLLNLLKIEEDLKKAYFSTLITKMETNDGK